MAIRHSRPTDPTAVRDAERLAADEMRDRAASLLREAVDDAGADGVDASTTAALAAEALGPDRVTGLVMPADGRTPRATDRR